MNKKFWIFIVLFVLWSCAPHYSLIRPEKINMGEVYSVQPELAWNGKTLGNAILWTQNGMLLDRIVFLNNIKDGDTLVDVNSSPKFRNDMNIIEIAELYSNSMQAVGQWAKFETKELSAQNFGPFEGFGFEIAMVNQGGLSYKGLVSGAVIDKKLFLIFFLATEMHYYQKYVDHFKRLVLSIKKL